MHAKLQVLTSSIFTESGVKNTINKIYSEGSKNIFIKMDIEGAEFKVLEKLDYSKVNILGLAIEFHDINLKEKEFNKIIINMKKIFHIAHIHGNNYSKIDGVSKFPSSVEITFINKKLVKGKIKKSEKKYPIEGLDQPNKQDNVSIID